MQLTQETVDVFEAILSRKSVRKFRPDPVPPRLLMEVLEAARYAPSWSNTQPWEVAVITGERLEATKKALSAKLDPDVATDIPWPSFPDHLKQRSRENGLRLFELLGIGRDDRDNRLAHNLASRRFFDAPAGLLFLLEKDLPVWSMLDLGLFMQTIMLSAVGRGLGTCALAAVAVNPVALRDLLNMPQSKTVVCGMAMGYPDEEAAVNEFRSNRIPVADFVRWYGEDSPLP